MTKRRALIASYHFPPSSAVGARRPARLARLLPAHGYEVDVVCADIDRGITSPDASQFGLIDKRTRVLRVATPFVLGRHPRLPPPSEHRLSHAGWKLRAYFEWLLFTRDWSWNWGRSAVRLLGSDLARKPYDVMIVEAPPGPAIAPFTRWARARELATVVDLRDVWATETDRWSVWWPCSPKHRRARWYVQLRDMVLESADHIVTTTAEMASFMSERVPRVASSRFTSVWNAYAEVDQTHDSKALSEPFQVVYTGSLAYGRAKLAESLVRAIGILKRKREVAVELVVAGSDGRSLLDVAREAGAADLVTIHPWLAREDAVALQRRAAVLALLQPDAFGTGVAVPAKLFEYMSRRKHILGLVGLGPAARLIREHRLGEVASGDDPNEIARALERLLIRVRHSPLLPPPPEQFSEGATVREFAEILDRVVDERTSAPGGAP